MKVSVVTNLHLISLYWLLNGRTTLTDVAAKVDSSQQAVVNANGVVIAEDIESDAVCKSVLLNLTSNDNESDGPLDGISFVIHRNGEPASCGAIKSRTSLIRKALTPFENKCNELTKYDVESLLTLLFAGKLRSNLCGSTDNSTAAQGLYGYCDMGPERTAELMDYDSLVRVPGSGSLPCRFYTREGVRVKSLSALANLAREAKQKTRNCRTAGNNSTCVGTSLVPKVHLYAVPASRVFMFAPSFVGEVFDLPHIQVDNGLPVSLEVLSVKPRVFDVKNFFSKEEADQLIQEALDEQLPERQLKRSYTGFSQDHVIDTRTSETGWPTWSDLVTKILERAFLTLGYDDLWLSHSDGIQVLRYTEAKAYAPHVDYIHDPDDSQMFDYDSTKKGGNRFATILLYMSELSEVDGGETVFSEAWPPLSSEDERIPLTQATEELRASGDASMLQEGSWEEEMVATCRTRLSVRPTLGRAVLFYSQHPNGTLDEISKHGGCPVLNGEKWAANVWLWNTPKLGYIKAPLKKSLVETPQPLYATFTNGGNDPIFKNAALFFEDTFWGKLGHGDPPLSVNTYQGHRWNIKDGEKTLKSFIIESDSQYNFVV